MTRRSPEHDFQRAAYVFLRKALPFGSKVQANDAARKGSPIQRILDAQRGVLAGWPDMVCLVAGFPEIYIECKSRLGQPTDIQAQVGIDIVALGRHWFCASALEHIEAGLREIGVPLRATTGERTAAPATKKRTNKKPAAPRVSPRQIARIGALRQRIMF